MGKLRASLPVYVRGRTETNDFRSQDGFNRAVKEAIESTERPPLVLPASAFQPGQVAANPLTLALGKLTSSAAAAQKAWAPLALDVGDRILSITVYCIGAAGGALTVKAFRTTAASGAATQFGATKTSALAATNQPLVISGMAELVTEAMNYVIEAAFPATAAVSLFGALVLRDRPN